MAEDEDTQKNTTGEVDPSIWDEQVAVTGRPQDEPSPNTTFAERAKSRPVEVAKVDEPAKPAKKTARKK